MKHQFKVGDRAIFTYKGKREPCTIKSLEDKYCAAEFDDEQGQTSYVYYTDLVKINTAIR